VRASSALLLNRILGPFGHNLSLDLPLLLIIVDIARLAHVLGIRRHPGMAAGSG
jgi:hypothetical protein